MQLDSQGNNDNTTRMPIYSETRDEQKAQKQEERKKHDRTVRFLGIYLVIRTYTNYKDRSLKGVCLPPSVPFHNVYM
jgi:hypothetical protein